VEDSELGLSCRRTCRRLARLLVLRPMSCLVSPRTVEGLFAPRAHQPPDAFVVLHVLDELADGVVGAEDSLVDELLGEVLSEERGEGGGGDFGGGEAENVFGFLGKH